MLIRPKSAISFLLLSLILLGCGSNSKTPQTNEAVKKIDAIIEKSSFEIISYWAHPLTTASMNQVAMAGLLPPGSAPGQISLIGNNNYFKIIGDSVAIYLPYFGERQMSGGYTQTDNSIQFKGVPKDYDIQWNEKKKRYDLLLSFANGTESFQVNGQLFPNLKSSITITSSFRFPIRYSGDIKAIEPD